MQILLWCVVTDIRKENRKRIFTLETCPVMIQSILHFDILSSILCLTNSMIAKAYLIIIFMHIKLPLMYAQRM